MIQSGEASDLRLHQNSLDSACEPLDSRITDPYGVHPWYHRESFPGIPAINRNPTRVTRQTNEDNRNEKEVLFLKRDVQAMQSMRNDSYSLEQKRSVLR